MLLVGSAFAAILAGCGGGGAPPQPLVITSSVPPSGTTQVVYGANGTGFSLTAAGGVRPYTWSWTSAAGSEMPPGLNVSTGLISGTPTTAGSFSVVVTVTDSATPGTHASSNYTIVVASSVGLAISSGPPPDGTAGVIYDRHFTGCKWGSPGCKCLLGRIFCQRQVFGFDLGATGGAGPYTWTWAPAAGSSLPPGLGLSVAGKIGGTPAAAGSYTAIVTVADAASSPDQTSVNYTIVINNPAPPVVDTSPLPPVGTLGTPYPSFSFTATGGLLPLTWAQTGALPPGMTFSSATGTPSGTPTATGQFPITVMVTDSAGQGSAPDNVTLQILATGFKPTGSMSTARACHTATLLNDGKVLVAGGQTTSGSAGATAELYDPSIGSFTTTGSMAISRAFHTGTLIKDGKVLVAGGVDSNGGSLTAAEVYDPAAGTFMATGNLSTGRAQHTATLLNGGKVLIAGGRTFGNPVDTDLTTAELFDPSTGTFSVTGSMSTARSNHTATLLNDGKVLLVGGITNESVSATAELYDPSTESFTTTGSMGNARSNHTATLLNNGKVLVAGGGAAVAEIYDPANGSFAATGNMETTRVYHTATLLTDGTVLVAGGYDGNRVLSSTEVFDPVAGTFTSVADMTTARLCHTATLLAKSQVLVTGGNGSNNVGSLASAELYY